MTRVTVSIIAADKAQLSGPWLSGLYVLAVQTGYHRD